MRGAWGYFATRKDDDGLSIMEREEQRQQLLWNISDRKMEAQMLRDIESHPIPCSHYPECPGELCTDTVEARKAADEQYQKTIAAIEAENTPAFKKPSPSQGPSTIKSKFAAAALSQPKQPITMPKPTLKPGAPSTKPRFHTSLASRPKKTPQPTNPSPMRHTAATAASKTTMGYAKGRATSATLRQTLLPRKDPRPAANELPDTTLAPADYIQRYGVPRLGSDMWFRCKTAGCFDEDDAPSLEQIFAGDNPHGMDTLLREEAEQEFQMTL